jgi:hypothetical protein
VLLHTDNIIYVFFSNLRIYLLCTPYYIIIIIIIIISIFCKYVGMNFDILSILYINAWPSVIEESVV